MTPQVTTFGPLLLESINTELIEMAVIAMVLPTVELYYHYVVKLTISVTVDTTPTRDLQVKLLHNPLWDGAGCVSGSCCTFNSPLWLCKNLFSPTTDDIELCTCQDEAVSNEDTPFEIVELYVQRATQN